MSVVVNGSAVSYSAPTTVDEALHIASRFGEDTEFIAGGTDTEVQRRLGLKRKPHTIDLTGIQELRRLDLSADALTIGALVTLRQLTSSPHVAQHAPLIARAASSIATPVIRNTATVGGNLLVSNRCTYYNQSPFWRQSIGSCLRDTGNKCLVTGLRNGKCFSRSVSDLAPALIALNAKAVIQSLKGMHSLPLHELYMMDGLSSIREFGGILKEVHIPLPAHAFAFRKLRTRETLDFSSLTAAAAVDGEGTLRVCLNGVAMAPVRVEGQVSQLSLGDIQRELRVKSKAVNNDLLPLDYRKRMIDHYVEELWNEVTLPERTA